jgi:hypothetical protein
MPNAIPDDMKVTIAKVIALQSLATDPGQMLGMTRSTMRWVKLGLVLRYSHWDYVPEEYRSIFIECRNLWQGAMMNYGKGMEFWAAAMLPCADVADDMIMIAGMEEMLDYRQMDYNFTNAVFGMDAWQMEEKEAREKKAAEEGN